MLYDVFISHASEDKDDFVRPLAELLRKHRIEVWYDEFSLRPGDSLRRSIDIGLAKSRFGIVVLSPIFFSKNWPQWELDGLVQRQMSSEQEVIIPIWHGVTAKDVAAYSPPLADKVALNSSDGLSRVVSKLLRLLKPEGSTLLIARDILIDHGYEPPVVTDDWWLNVVESSAGNDAEGTFQEAMGWGRWGFPLPPRDTAPAARGARLAWAAMQMMWQERARELSICQITPPDQVLNFIRSQPGLSEACFRDPLYLISYAPQLLIPGFAGEFEELIESLYQWNLNCWGSFPTLFALRHPEFGHCAPEDVAACYVQGELNGPPVRLYDQIDYIAWLLSEASSWMPQRIRAFLLKGMKEWAVWPSDLVQMSILEVEPRPDSGAFVKCLHEAKLADSLKLSKAGYRDIQGRLQFAADLLGLPESGTVLTERFLTSGFIEGWLQRSEKNGARQKGTVAKGD